MFHPWCYTWHCLCVIIICYTIPANLRWPKRLRFWIGICHHPHGPAGSRHISAKPHNIIVEHFDSQHVSFYWNKEVTLRFSKYLFALGLLEAPSDGMDATVINSILRQDWMRQGCILRQHIFDVGIYTDSVIREAYIEVFGIKTGGMLVYNLRNADDIALYTVTI